MQPALRLTEAPDLKLHPEDLFHLLERSFMSFDSVVKELNCSLDNLEETLAASETSNLLKLKMNVSALQVQLLALRAAPHCLARLISLTNETEKPDVGRRAATAVLHIAGIATTTAAQPPAPPPVPPPPSRDPKASDMDPDEAYSALAAISFAKTLFKHHSLKFPYIPSNQTEALIAAIRPFLKPISPPEPHPPTTNH